MKLDSKWKESILETSDIFLALIFGVALEKAIASIYPLVLEIEGIIAVITIAIAVLWKKFRESTYEKFRNVVLRGARWVIGILAGMLFTTGYSLATAFLLLGVFITALDFGLVVSIIHYAKTVKDREGSSGNKESMPKKFGIPKEVTAELLGQLFNKREKLEKEYGDLSLRNAGRGVESMEMIAIRQQREATDQKISETREWYGLSVLETLGEESRTLKRLTIGLIALTVVLTIFTGFLVSGIRFP